MKKNISINFSEQKIIVSKAFYKKASAYGTAEYNELRKAMMENPNFEIVTKTVEKKSYNGLSFKRMEAYIMTQLNSEANLREFKAVQSVATAKGAKYPLTKKWFLQTFPEYKVNEVSTNETEAILNTSTHHANIFEDVAA